MSLKNIRLILLREVRDQLRDRRTLFMVAILPLLLYPALGIGMLQMTLLFTEQPRTVVVVGAENLPQEPALIDGDHFAAQWLSLPSDVKKLRVVSDQGEPAEDESGAEARLLLEQAGAIRQRLAEREELDARVAEAEEAGDRPRVEELTRRLEQVREELGLLFGKSAMQVLIIVPEGFGERLGAAHGGDGRGSAEMKLVRNQADEKSQLAHLRVKEAIDSWAEKIKERRFRDAGLPADYAEPVSVDSVDVAREEQIAATLWSKLVPALLVIMAVTGAFYPAIDLAAGEKERGTMETLLICPATRSEIVLGKFLTVLLFSMSTAVLNLLSMGFTGRYMASVAGAGGGGLERVGALQPPSGLAILWIVVLLVPLAALFSALCLSLATFARSSKEGQYYLTPLLMVTMGLTIFCLSPGIEINPFYSTMPVVGVALLLKKVLAAPDSVESLLYAVPVLVTSVGYSLLALWWAIEQFSREEVLFREAERFDLRLWLRHLLRDKEATPSFAEAGFCFVLIMLLQFAALKFFGDAVRSAPGDEQPLRMVQLLMMQQLVIVASPALFMGVILTTNVRRTFRLRWPSWKMAAAAAVLAVTLLPLSVELLHSLHWYFPSNSLLQEVNETMKSHEMPLWLIVLAFGVVPPVCEELAFRGFILSGFLRSGRVGLAIALSSITFGIMHQIPIQVFNAALLGLVLGLIAVRSGSLLPGILFHLIYNSLQVLSTRLDPAAVNGSPARWFVGVPIRDGGLRYEWPTLLFAAAVAILVLRWLANQGTPSRDARYLHAPVLPPPDGARRLNGNPPVRV